ncbi:MAG: M20/M25/M40 family metallo-hydrolase [candidate division WOR-3 bacterium]
MKRFIFLLLTFSGLVAEPSEFLIRVPFSHLQSVKEAPVVPVAFFENSIIGKVISLNLPFNYNILTPLPVKEGEKFFIVYPSPYMAKSEVKSIIERYGEILCEDGDAFFIKGKEEISHLLPPLGFDIALITLEPVILPEEREISPPPRTIGPKNPFIQRILDQITPTEIAQLIREFTGEIPVVVRGRLDTIRTRYTASSKNSVALWYLYEKMANFNLDSVNFHLYSSDSNIIGTKMGRVYPRQYYIIGGHLDCVSEQSSTYAPGADDNASGTIAALIAAKYLSPYPFKYTIKFIGWNGEEQGLLGSAAHAQLAQSRGDSIKGVLNADMIATEITNQDSVKIYNGTRTGSIALGDTFSVCNQRYNIGLRVWRINSAPANSDHYSYYSRGFEAIMAHEGNFSPNYHSTRDRITAAEFDTIYLTKVVKALVATLATLAQPIVSGVSYHRHIILDSAPLGNGDGILNPGESCEMPTWVKNYATYQVLGVKGILRHSQPDPNVILSDSIKYFGTIPAGDSAFTGLNGFNITVSPACTNGYLLPLEFVATDTLESTWVTPLNIKVGAPILLPEGIIAWDSPPGGNGNGKIDPGEEASIGIGIKNRGLGNGYNVTAILKSTDSRLLVLDSFGSYGTILRDSVKFNTIDRFRISASSSIPREFPIPCTLKIYCAGDTFIRPFNIIVGEMTIADPIPDGPRTPARYWAYDDIDTFYTEAPRYNWVELRNRGTQLPITSDDQTIRIPLPFVFKYYGQRYTESLSVCSNGWISPIRTTSTVYTNQPLPDPTSANPSAMICPNWDDLYPPYGNRIWYLYEPDSHRFILEWDSVHYYSPNTQWDKFEVIVYDTTVLTQTGDNEIVFQYYTANNYISNTVGIEDETNQIGINALYNNTYDRRCAPLAPRRAIKFTTDEPQVGMKEAKMDLSRKTFILPTLTKGKFSFTLPSFRVKKFEVYTVTGQRVKTLTIPKGAKEITWYGEDERGRDVPTGIYILRIIGEEKETKKIIFLR